MKPAVVPVCTTLSLRDSMKLAVVQVRTVLEGLHEAGCCPSVHDLVLERLHEAGCCPSVYDLVLEGLHEAGCCASVHDLVLEGLHEAGCCASAVNQTDAEHSLNVSHLSTRHSSVLVINANYKSCS